MGKHCESSCVCVGAVSLRVHVCECASVGVSVVTACLSVSRCGVCWASLLPPGCVVKHQECGGPSA